MLWANLQDSGLNPRLCNVRTSEVWIHGICWVNYGENGHGFYIAACWYDLPEAGEAVDNSQNSRVDKQDCAVNRCKLSQE